MHPHVMLRWFFIHPKDRYEFEEQEELVYEMPGKNCDT